MKATLPTIAFVSMAPLGIGGLEKNLIQIIEALKHKYRFLILASFTPEFEEAFEEVLAYVTCHSIRGDKRFDLATIRSIRRHVKRENVALLHSLDPRGRVAGHVAARSLGIPTVHTFHISPLDYETQYPAKLLLFKGLERISSQFLTDFSIFVSENIRKRYVDSRLVSASESATVHNGVTPVPVETQAARENHRTSFRRSIGIDPDDVVFTFVGRFTEQKGLDYLVDALVQLGSERARELRVRTLWVGDGPLRRSLEAALTMGKVESLVKLVGYQPNKDIPGFLRASDVFILPSRFECLPYSILEAMNYGLPCLVSDVGGNAELVENGSSGLVVPSGNITELVNALACLAESSTLRAQFGETAKRKLEAFSLSAMIRKTETVYARFLGAES